MAIVSTLWSLALLGAIAISLSFTGNISYRLAENSLHVVSEDALADAAVNLAVLALVDPRPEKRWLPARTSRQFIFGGATLGIHLQDELGKIDLNQADGSTLATLFQSAGLDAASAGALAEKILDWRDSNPLKRLNGANADDYRAAGLPYRPRNGAFQSVDELTLVMGMTRDLYLRINPAVTVFSGRQFVDPQLATPEVLAAFPSLANVQLATVGSDQTPSAALGGVGNPMTGLKGRAFTIDIEISRVGMPVYRHGVLRLTGNADEPFWMLDWQRS